MFSLLEEKQDLVFSVKLQLNETFNLVSSERLKSRSSGGTLGSGA